MPKNRHVVPRNGRWAVRTAGSNQVSSTHRTQRAAIRTARTGAMRSGTEMIIHGRNGRIRARNSYGNDPHPPKG